VLWDNRVCTLRRISGEDGLTREAKCLDRILALVYLESRFKQKQMYFQ